MNPIYARQVLKYVTDEAYDFNEDRETLKRMAEKLHEAYENGQQNPNSAALNKVRETEKFLKVIQVHIIGDHWIVESRAFDKDKPNIYGVWSGVGRGKHGPSVLCSYYTIEEALLASIALRSGDAEHWNEANYAVRYVMRMMGIPEKGNEDD